MDFAAADFAVAVGVDFVLRPADFAAGLAVEGRDLRAAAGLLGWLDGGFADGFVAGRVLEVEWRPGFLASELPAEFVVSLTSEILKQSLGNYGRSSRGTRGFQQAGGSVYAQPAHPRREKLRPPGNPAQRPCEPKQQPPRNDRPRR